MDLIKYRYVMEYYVVLENDVLEEFFMIWRNIYDIYINKNEIIN